MKNMKRQFLALALAICSICASNAQKIKIGVHAGTNVSNLSGGDTYRIYGSKYKVGAEIGADIVYTTKNKFTVTSGIGLLTGGGKFSVLSDYYSDEGQSTEFKEVNARPLYIQVPITMGYNISLGKSITLNPNIGLYGRYAFASFKENVTLAYSKREEKWNCFDNYDNGNHHIDAFKRFDYGIAANINVVLDKHYSLSFGYKYGLAKLSQQYGMKERSLSINIGYIW